MIITILMATTGKVKIETIKAVCYNDIAVYQSKTKIKSTSAVVYWQVLKS
jgi:hypothetical protein